jgi:PTS system nitrogen regulatory IIA component
MPKLAHILTPERMHCNAQISSKRRALDALSDLFKCSQDMPSHDKIYEQLLMRERLGSTGIGQSVAIPHARIEGINSIQAAFLQLKTGVNYDAPDGQAVDLLMAVLVPNGTAEQQAEHLQILAQLASLFSNAEVCQQLRSNQLSSAEKLHVILDFQITL